MKFFALIAAAAAIRITTDPIGENKTVDAAVQNHKSQQIAAAFADDQAEHTRHHYGGFTPSGTNSQTFGNQSTGSFYGGNRVQPIETTTSVLPLGQNNTGLTNDKN